MKDGTDRITVEEAARIIGTTPQMVRFNMRKGNWKIGMVIKPEKGKKHHRYYVYRSLVNRLVGGVVA